MNLIYPLPITLIDMLMRPIEKALFEIESIRIQQLISEEDIISPRVQLFLDECKRIITIFKDDDLLEKERERYL